MPFIPVPNTVEVESVYELDGQIVENTAYFTSSLTWDETSITNLLTLVRDRIEEDLLPLLSTVIKLVRVVGTLLDAVDSLGVVLNVSPPVSGSATGTPIPNNNSYTVTFLTSARGRSGRGRNYVPGLIVNDLADTNRVDPDFRTGVLAYYEALRSEASELGATMVVVSRYSGVDSSGHPIPRVEGVTNAITGFTTYDDVVDSQRRRLPGRGL